MNREQFFRLCSGVKARALARMRGTSSSGVSTGLFPTEIGVPTCRSILMELFGDDRPVGGKGANKGRDDNRAGDFIPGSAWARGAVGIFTVLAERPATDILGSMD
jgi:hypothetical protein